MAIVIQNSSDISTKDPIRMILYGKPKRKKTRATAMAPRPFFFDFDHGMRSTRDLAVPYSQPESFEDFLRDQSEWVAKEASKYNTLVYDSGTTLYSNYIAASVLSMPIKLPKDTSISSAETKGAMVRRETMSVADYGLAHSRFSNLLLNVMKLPHHFVLILHEKEQRDTEGSVISHDMSLPGQLPSNISILFDIVLHVDIFFNKDAGGPGIPGQTVMFCSKPSAMYEAGDRSGRLDELEPPDLGAIFAKVLA